MSANRPSGRVKRVSPNRGKCSAAALLDEYDLVVLGAVNEEGCY